MATSATLVQPAAPTVSGPVPWVGGGLGLLSDPTAFFARQRLKHGDTFVVEAFGHHLFCVFSPEGVRSLYAQPEDEASFGIATYQLIKAKVPVELLLGRRNHPKALFGSQRVEDYLGHLHRAVDLEMARLGPSGTFEAFAQMRRLGHRLGLASWAGSEAAAEPYIEQLIPLFDRLDSSESFVRPGQAALTWATRKRREWAAMAGIERIFGEIIEARSRRPPVDDFLTQILDSYSDLPEEERAVATARDVIVIHMGSQSNLYAALAWTLVNLLQRPELVAQVRDGDDSLLDRCANESIRMAQRSITLRQVLTPIDVDTGGGTYRLGPGVLLCTMLSSHNTTAAPGLDHFDPDHYEGRRLSSQVALPTKELVSTFGHGVHSCPAARFSIAAIRVTIQGLLGRYELTPQFTHAAPRRRQIGGVARSARPCRIRYRLD